MSAYCSSGSTKAGPVAVGLRISLVISLQAPGAASISRSTITRAPVLADELLAHLATIGAVPGQQRPPLAIGGERRSHSNRTRKSIPASRNRTVTWMM